MTSRHLAGFCALIFSAWMLVACEYNTQTVWDENSIIYSTGTGYNANWEDTFGIYEGVAIPNGECALSIATAILNSIESGNIRHVPAEVFFDEEALVWVVHFIREPTSDGAFFAGDGCSIVLQQKDGKVLRIQFSE